MRNAILACLVTALAGCGTATPEAPSRAATPPAHAARWTVAHDRGATECAYLRAQRWAVDRAVRSVRGETVPELRDAADEGCRSAYR